MRDGVYRVPFNRLDIGLGCALKKLIGRFFALFVGKVVFYGEVIKILYPFIPQHLVNSAEIQVEEGKVALLHIGIAAQRSDVALHSHKHFDARLFLRRGTLSAQCGELSAP